MSSQRKLLAIPGPIELSSNVLNTLSLPPLSHVSPDFISIFQQCQCMTRQVVGSTKESGSEVFIVSGSGTLGWDMVGGNLIEEGDKVCVVSTGYFGEGIADCLKIYGAQVDFVRAPSVGATASLQEIEEALRKNKYKALTITHVDTSTGVLSDVKGIAQLVKKVSPETLIIVDGVCSVASEDLEMDKWELDIILTASQKGLGVPPGLSIVVASRRAITHYQSRQAAPRTYYASWSKWLPIMQSYESGKPAYFATPSVNLVRAYHASLKEITGKGEEGIKERLEMHKKVSERVKMVARQLGLKEMPKERRSSANGMTAVYLPDGMKASEVLPKLGEKGIVVAGGLISDIKDQYIRIGHMGTSVVDSSRGDIEKMTDSLSDVFNGRKE